MPAGLTERTQVVVSLGHVVAAVIAICLAHGAWTWALEKQIQAVVVDVAVIKAAVVPERTAVVPSPFEPPTPEPSPVFFSPAAVAADRRHFRGHP